LQYSKLSEGEHGEVKVMKQAGKVNGSFISMSQSTIYLMSSHHLRMQAEYDNMQMKYRKEESF